MPPGFEKLFEWGPPYVALGALALSLWKGGRWIATRLFEEETETTPGGLVTRWVNKQIEFLDASKKLQEKTLLSVEIQTSGIATIERRINDILASARDPEEMGQLVELLLDQLPIPLAQVNEMGFFMRSNATFRQVLGYTEDELQGMTVMDVTPSAPDAAAETDARQKIIRGTLKTFRIEKLYRRKDGLDVFCALYAFRFPQIGPFRFFVSCVIPLHAPHTLR